jgi:hypothetical protein
MSNSFERYAAAMHIPQRARKARVVKSDADAPLVPTASEKKQRDETTQFLRYKRAVRAQSTALMNSEHGPNYRMLLSLLKRLTTLSAQELLNYVREAKWISHCDADQKFVVLAMIDMTIMRTRVRAGLPTFDDALPGEPDNLFLIIRNIIGA